MSEPSLERLSRFTPDAGALDRDTLLFAAGRASARPNRAWIALAAVLAATQALTLALALLWPRPAAHAVLQPVPAPAPAVESPPPEPPESPGVWSARHSLVEPDLEDRPAPAAAGTLIESEPPLRAFAPPPPSLLN
jgi:hypothetical protein